MKAENLMIGDWVRITLRNKIGKVYRIDEANGKGNGWVAVIDGDYHETHLEPIPLTPEILEKNGFLADKHVYPYPYYEYEVKENKVKVGFAFPQGNKTSYKEPWVYIDSERVFIEHLPCVFIHQLQHALRLCGIKKEIEL